MTVEISTGHSGIDFLTSMLSAYTAFWRGGIWPTGRRLWWWPQEVDNQCSAWVPLLAPGVFLPKQPETKSLMDTQLRLLDPTCLYTGELGVLPHGGVTNALQMQRRHSPFSFLMILNNCTVSPMLLGAPTRIKPITLCEWYVILYSCLAVAASLTHLLISLPTGFTWEIFLIIHFHKKSCLRDFLWGPKLMIPSQQPIFFFFKGERNKQNMNIWKL